MQRTPAVILGIAVLVSAVVIGFVAFSASASPSAGAGASSSASTQPAPSDPFAADALARRWTVLYVGSDLNTRRERDGEPVNTDALMLVSLSADQSELALVSLPRDTVDLPLAGGGTYEQKINSLYRERGMDALVGAMEALYAVRIDAHLVLDMDDFAELVDAVGGVEVAPDQPIDDPVVALDIPSGPQTLDGREALAYVRTRVDQDYGRMARQQEVLLALARRLVDPATEVDLPAVMDGLESLQTDLPLGELPTLLELARRATQADVEELVIRPPLITFEGDRGDGLGYVLEADVEAIRADVQRLIGD